MSVPQWLLDLGVPPGCIERGAGAKERRSSFVLLCGREHAVWRVHVDGGWMTDPVQRKVDFAFHVECAGGQTALVLVELKGGDFGHALTQIEGTLVRLAELPAYRSAAPEQRVRTAYVVLTNGNAVPQELVRKAQIQRRHGVVVKQGSRRIEAPCPCT